MLLMLMECDISVEDSSDYMLVQLSVEDSSDSEVFIST